MSTFVMDDTPATQNSTGGGGLSEEDKAKLNAERGAREAAIIETLGTQDKAKSVAGYISGYIDLGEQSRGDYEEKYEPESDKHKKLIADGEGVVREGWVDREKCTVIATKRKPGQAFTFTVDFPQYMIDYGEKIGKKPYRMLFSHVFTIKKADGSGYERIIDKPLFKTVSKNNPANKWGFGLTTTVHKMAAAAGVLNADKLFLPKDLPKLFHKPLQFNVQAYMKPSNKGDGKEYFTEYISLAGDIPEGLPLTPWDENLFFGVNMLKANDPNAIKQLRWEVKNTIKRALNYDKSVIKGELEGGSDASKPIESKPADTPAKPAEKAAPDATPASKPAEPASDGEAPWDDDVMF